MRRYALRRAAETIARADKVNKGVILGRLLHAAWTSQLPTYERRSTLIRKPSRAISPPQWVSDEFDTLATCEAYANDLNAWLDRHEPRIKYRFPEPTRPPPRAETSVTAWKDAARAFADEVALARWKSGDSTSMRAVSKPVALRLRNDKKYWSNRGPRSDGNVRNKALPGWTFTPPNTGTSGTSGTNIKNGRKPRKTA
jgi:hypothetical protein